MEHETHRILHIADSPNDTRLLAEQLRHCGIEANVHRAGSLLGLRTAMREPPSLIVADLPLPWAEADLLAIRATQPRLPVVFRFGHPGNWHVDDPCLQIGRAVAKALALDATRHKPASPDHLAHVRMQRALLQLGRLDHRDFAASLRATTETIAEVFAIERVSVWELDDDGALRCLDLFTASQRTHVTGTRLLGISKYRRLLEEEVTIATPDATADDRFTEFNGWYLQANRITSMLDTPIRTNGRVAGVLCLEHVGQPRSWSIVDMDGAAAMAHLIGGALTTRDRLTAEANLERARKAEALGRIAAQLAHDFNNRLTVITLLVDQLAQEASSPTQIETTRLLADELVRARDKVRTMLAGRVAAATSADTTDVGALLNQELSTLRRMVAPHTLEFV
ncbi:MAG: GAF domain-containing protein, partial [Planctomycetes bacterium]|nr:GAF domain-containing protein [Planctomycetota bacterium]